MAAVVDESILHITPEGINARAIDAAQVCLVAINVKKDAFKEFECTPCDIAIDIERLAGMTSKLDKSGDTTLIYDEVKRQLLIKCKGLDYKASVLAPSSITKEPKMPGFELPVRLSLPGSELKKGAGFVEYVAEHVRFGTESGKFYMEGVGSTDSVRYDAENIIIERPGDARSAFALKYLNDMLKVIGKADKVIIELGVDFPVRIITDMDDGEFVTTYMVAPRTDEED